MPLSYAHNFKAESSDQASENLIDVSVESDEKAGANREASGPSLSEIHSPDQRSASQRRSRGDGYRETLRTVAEGGAVIVAPLLAGAPLINMITEFAAVVALVSLVLRGLPWLAVTTTLIALALGGSGGGLGQVGMVGLTFTAKALVPALVLALTYSLSSSLKKALWLSIGFSLFLSAMFFAVGGEMILAAIDSLQEILVTGSEGDSESLLSLLAILRRFAPAQVAISSLTGLALAFALAPYLPRLQKVWNIPYRQWRFSYGLLAVTLSAALGRILFSSGGWQDLTWIFDNALVSFLILFSVGGMAVAEDIFSRARVSWFVRGAFYFFMLSAFHYGLVAMALVGICDTQFDLRARLQAAQKKRRESSQ